MAVSAERFGAFALGNAKNEVSQAFFSPRIGRMITSEIRPLALETGWAALLSQPEPVLALAPMQDVTDLPFWRLIREYGGADVYFTEYFRVTSESRLSKTILSSITGNPTGRPVVAQMIGNDIPALVRTARELQEFPIVAIDLNLGCPAPVVYRKCAGGGLLRDLERTNRILGALRDAIPGRFTVKTRLGFDDVETLDELLPIVAKHAIDLLTIHGRTVKQMYRGGVRYDLIGEAVRALDCPVLANGNVASADGAADVLRSTGARGLMIGRGVVRNPWLFEQIRQKLRGEQVVLPTGRQVLAFIHALYEAVCDPEIVENQQVQKMKKYANFLGAGIDATGTFLHDIRRANGRGEFFAICSRALDHEDAMPLVPFAVDPATA
jgi:tRNA-dihydrouridine synthase B